MGDDDDDDDDDEDYVPSEGKEEKEEQQQQNEDTPQWDAAALKSMLPPSDSWKCEVCLVPNKPDLVKCRSCGSNKPGTKSEETSDGPSFGGFSMVDTSSMGLTFGTS